jgi:hypothetical protein
VLEPASVTVGEEQVIAAGAAMLALGGVVLDATVVVAVFVQPLEGLVTVSVYGPGAVTP